MAIIFTYEPDNAKHEAILNYPKLHLCASYSWLWCKCRDKAKGEVASQEIFIPGMIPKIPGRFYYLFGKPIKLKGREDLVQNRASANEVYLQAKAEVERCIGYLLKKREEDPFRSIINRLIYRTFYAPLHQVPSFKPWKEKWNWNIAIFDSIIVRTIYCGSRVVFVFLTSLFFSLYIYILILVYIPMRCTGKVYDIYVRYKLNLHYYKFHIICFLNSLQLTF